MDENTLVSTIKNIVSSQHEEDRQLMLSMVARHEEGEHHQFIRAEIEKEARRQEMWQRLKGNIIFWLLTGVTATIGLALWNHYVDKQ